MKPSKSFLKLLLLMTLSVSSSFAEQRITLGAKLLGAGWQGDNGAVSGTFNSDKGGQLAFSLAYSEDKFYSAINLQNGNYTFDSNAPDKFTPTGRISNFNVEIQQQELDLIVGYYFWKNISLFADIKAVTNTWSNDSYKQTFSGLGFGATAYLPFNEQWTWFGSAGFVGQGEIKDDNKDKVGDGRSSALELAAIYRLTDVSSINFGLKFRNYRFEYLNNSTQDYSVNALFIGYNHGFEI